MSTASFFGDFDVEDAYDTEPADPHQVARRLHRYRVLIDRLAGHELADYDDLSDAERADVDFVGQRIVQWVHAHPPGDDFAEVIHEAGRSRLHEGEAWDSLSDDLKQLALAIARLISAWLLRQGAWR